MMQNKITSLSDLFNLASMKTLGNLPKETIFSTLAYCVEADDMPNQDESIIVFKDVPAKLIEVKIEDVIDVLMNMPEISDFSCFDDYHNWYINRTNVPKYTLNNRWPSIVDDSYEIDDGWHRMHSYIRDGHKTLPLLHYDCKEWWKAHENWKSNLINKREKEIDLPNENKSIKKRM